MRRERSLDLIDAQSGGDVSRVVTAGIEPIPGATALEKARYLQREGDGLRRLLLSEPYGDPAMSVDLIVEPGHPEAQAGYIIMEAMGYPLYSGSNTICVATVLLQSGMIEMTEGLQDVVLESPAGLARVSARNVDGRVESITTQGEPAYVAERGLSVDVPDYGRVEFDLVWSGAYYAMIHAADHGFDLTPDEQIALTAFGDAFVRAARPGLRQEHPATGRRGSAAVRPFHGQGAHVGERQGRIPLSDLRAPGRDLQEPDGDRHLGQAGAHGGPGGPGPRGHPGDDLAARQSLRGHCARRGHGRRLPGVALDHHRGGSPVGALAGHGRPGRSAGGLIGSGEAAEPVRRWPGESQGGVRWVRCGGCVEAVALRRLSLRHIVWTDG